MHATLFFAGLFAIMAIENCQQPNCLSCARAILQISVGSETQIRRHRTHSKQNYNYAPTENAKHKSNPAVGSKTYVLDAPKLTEFEQSFIEGRYLLRSQRLLLEVRYLIMVPSTTSLRYNNSSQFL